MQAVQLLQAVNSNNLPAAHAGLEGHLV